jgi:hypothetical protein
MARSAPLSNEARALCRDCGQPTWVYETPIGDRIALDNAPGEYVIDGGNKIYRTFSPDGYRAHHDHCRATRSPLTGEVTAY